jgi:hypothetical protein
MLKRMIWATLVALTGMALASSGQCRVPGSESAALAGISVVLENPWSTAGNPSGLAGFGKLTVCTNFEQLFLLKGLGNYAFALTVPAGNGTFGTCLEYEGYKTFSKETFILSYGRKFSSSFSAGAGLFYILQKAGDRYKALHQVSYSLGFRYSLSDKFCVAFSAFNPFNLYYESGSYASLPALFRLGLAYNPSSSLSIMTELEKDLDYPVSFRIGCEFNAGDRFFIRGGLKLLPAEFSLGAGFLINRLMIGISAAYHQYLGCTPVTSLQYLIK